MMLHYGKYALAVFIACALLANVACATEWNLAADYSVSANPAGQWAYGYLKDGVFNIYDFQTILSAQGSQCHGWRVATDDSWCFTGNISKNLGPGIIDAWGGYLEIGTCKVQGSDDLVSLPGAQWTCSISGQYLVSAKFSGIWFPAGARATTVKVMQGTTELASGVIDGFVGRSVNSYSDGFGNVRYMAYDGVLDLQAGENLQFVGGGAGGNGNTVQLDISVWPATDCCEISGHVTDEDTHIGIADANVTTSDGLFSATTDGSGFYQITVPAGSVTLKVSAVGYADSGATFEATTGTITKDFALRSNAILTGLVVYDATGQGIPGATVTAGSAVTTTDYWGNYAFELPSGTYTLTAKAGGYVSATVADVVLPRGSETIHTFYLDMATISSVADDFADPLANPCGVWDYGFLDVYGSFTVFDTPESATPDTGNGMFKGWHVSPSWTTIGALGKNVGTDPIDSWGWYTEVGQVVALTSNSELALGARWMCPSAGRYKVYAGWTSQDTAVLPDVATVMLLQNGDLSNPLRQGTINGFAGRRANGYLDRMADGEGTPTETYFDATVDIDWYQTLEFAASAPTTSQGHHCGLSAIVMPVSALGTISGTVTLSGTSTPVPGVTISTLDGRIGTQTDSQGYYSLDAPAGSQQVAARHLLCDGQTAPVSVTVGSTTTQNFQLVAVRATVKGQVTSAATGDPLVGATVELADRSVSTLTGVDGRYEMLVPVGTYSLIASKGYFGCQQVDNVVAGGLDPIVVNFSLASYGWDLASDYSMSANPEGQWSYGYLNGGVFNLYDYQTILSAQGSECHGWRMVTDDSWCFTGNISKNLGPGIIDVWGAYLETGTCKVQGCDDLVSLPGAQWTSPATGQYLYMAKFSGNWYWEGGHSMIVKVTQGATELASGVITGFIGRLMNNYSDGFGDVRQLTYGGVLNLAAGENIQFVGGGQGGYGNTVQLDISVFSIADCCQVSGYVTDESSVGISGATVATSDGALSTTTDGSGYYHIVVPPGRVTLNATASGCEGGTTTFTATAGGTLTGKNIVLTRLEVEVPTLVALRSVPDGTSVILTDPAIATAGKATFKSGSIYVEDSTRTMGIKVLAGSGAPDVQIGDRVTFSGVVDRDASDERCITGSVVIASTPGTPVRPLGMSSRGLGSFVYGLSVTVWGKVTARTADYLYLDDGSGLLDGTGDTGIRVNLSDIAESGSAPSQSYILVKGILGKSMVGITIVPTIYPTSFSAMQGLTP